mmetsp:Transcript_65383/g.108631  ORF Transcript_65383/g.108631 Transcript_65383/m.108631 type:complete len:208 (+) Transcript_65383:868-1491(+)
MKLINEEDDARLRLRHLLQHRLQALLELPAVRGPGHERPHVQTPDLALQSRGDVPSEDALGQAFHDGGLPDAGLPDQHGVVLGAPRQDPDDPPDLVVPSNHRVELPHLRQLHHVHRVLAQRLEMVLRPFAVHLAVPSDQLDGLLALLPRKLVCLKRPTHVPVLEQRQQKEVQGQVAVPKLLLQVASLVEDLQHGATQRRRGGGVLGG